LKVKIWTALITVYIVWGSTYLAIRFAIETMPPFLMAATRFIIAGAILYTWQRLAKNPAPTKKQWRSAAVVGLFLLLGGNGGVVWAEQHIPSGIAALLVGTAPMWMVIIDAIRPGGNRPSWQTVSGILIGFAGITILIGPAELSGQAQSFDTLGIIALLLAGLFWAIGSLYSRTACLPDSPLLGTGMEMIIGGAGLLIAGTITGEWSRVNLATISVNSLLGLAYLVFFGALVGFAAYTWLLRVAPTPLVSTYAYINPLIAIFLGNILAHEPLTPQILISALVILSSVALINTSSSAKPKSSASYRSPSSCRDD
jgi:drug/metabolite transporter (DMT)-like permease